MNRHLKNGIALAASLVLMTACGSKDNSGEKAKADYDRALSDSIELFSSRLTHAIRRSVCCVIRSTTGSAISRPCQIHVRLRLI